MKFCPNCGTELKPEAKFCVACGTPVTVSPSEPPPPAYQQQQEPVYEQAKEATNAFTNAVSGKTNLIQRVINILTKPKEEWLIIANERPDKMKLLFGYVIVLALVPAAISFVTFAFINSYFSIGYAFVQAVISFLLTIAVVFLTAFVVDALAPSFDSEKNFDRSFQLVCYAYTPGWIASILGIIPGINVVASLIGFAYIIYLLIMGVPLMKRTPSEKVTAYTILSVLIMIVIYFVLKALLALIFLKAIFGSMMFNAM